MNNPTKQLAIKCLKITADTVKLQTQVQGLFRDILPILEGELQLRGFFVVDGGGKGSEVKLPHGKLTEVTSCRQSCLCINSVTKEKLSYVVNIP